MSKELIKELKDYIESLDNDISLINQQDEIDCCDYRESEVLINVRNYLTSLVIKNHPKDKIMFNKTLILPGNQSHYHNHNTKVTEKKAPTDESMRLLDEFKKEAKEAVVERGLIKVPSIDAEIAFMKSVKDFGYEMHYMVVLNGKKIKGSYDIDELRDEDMMATIIDKVSKKIAANLIIKTHKEIV